MKEYYNTVNLQLRQNSGKNLFHGNADDNLCFAPQTVFTFHGIKTAVGRQREEIIDHTVQSVLREFCRVNQYISFDSKAKEKLYDLYAQLLSAISEGNSSSESLSASHYGNIRKWLELTNPFVTELYRDEGEYLQPVCCSQYSAELQLKILHIEPSGSGGPILDIGCGEHGELVNYFMQNGYEAYGIDRFCNCSAILQNLDWLEYNYGERRWGTIISNLGFSNHFHNHHLRKDGDHLTYARKYMEILQSLKTGGTFHYAPDLPFIEQYLSDAEYAITNFEIAGIPYKSTVITRLK